MVEQHDGEVPHDHEELLALPGVGAYTAAAVSCFAFGNPEVVIDTNVRRVLARTLEGKALPHLTLNRAESDLARAAMPADRDAANTWNVAVMELGALICVARGPRCEECPVADLCAWNVAGRPAYDGPPDAGRPGTAPTARCAGRSCAGCARRTRRCRSRRSRTPATTRPGDALPRLPRGRRPRSSRCRASASASPPDPRLPLPAPHQPRVALAHAAVECDPGARPRRSEACVDGDVGGVRGCRGWL